MNLRKLKVKDNYNISLNSKITDIIKYKLKSNLNSPKGLILNMVSLNNIDTTIQFTECIGYFDLIELNYKYKNIVDETCDYLNCANCIFDHSNVKELLKIKKYKEYITSK
jgi:hypothetical protein